MRFAGGVDPDFDRSGIVMLSVDLDLQGYDPERGRLFQRSLLERLHAVPAWNRRAWRSYCRWTSRIPVPPCSRKAMSPDQTVKTAAPASHADRPVAFRSHGVAGRAIDERDTETKPRAAVIDEAPARRYRQTPERAIGRKFSVLTKVARWDICSLVGVKPRRLLQLVGRYRMGRREFTPLGAGTK